MYRSTMEWKTSIEQVLDVVLRVPPLFVIDSILKNTFLWPLAPTAEQVWDLKFLFWVFINIVSFAGALIIFILDTPSLITAHRFLASGTNLCFSYYFNTWFVAEELKNEEYTDDFVKIFISAPYNFLFNLFIQITISVAYNYLQLNLPSQHRQTSLIGFIKKMRAGTYPVLLLPLLLRIISISPGILKKAPLLSCLLMSVEFQFLLITSIHTTIRKVKNSYVSAKLMYGNFGIQSFLEFHWNRLHIPNVLRVFWIVRTLYIFAYLAVQEVYNWESDQFKVILEYTKDNNANSDNTNSLVGNISTVLKEENRTVINLAFAISQLTLTLSCDTIIALMGMTSIVSRLAHNIGLFLTWYVQSNNEEDRSLGTMSAILFFILALQTGLTSMHPTKRLIRLYRNFCLLFTAILHFVHGMVNPMLMNLSASQHHNLNKHIRPLSMCLFLMTFPVLFLYYLWQDNTPSTWLLAVTAFSIEVVIKVFVSLLVYTLFMLDAYREVFWEKLDDYVYYVKACGNSIEFLFGIFLFCNGAWIMVFESGGTIRAVMMCIHAYFNIWVQAKEGWKTFIKRRNAVKKINSLPEASLEQLENLNDVCAICYQELTTARVTRCNHYFHGVCLRKWLYLQDVCPMCHEEIYAQENVENDDSHDHTAVNGNVVHEHHN